MNSDVLLGPTESRMVLMSTYTPDFTDEIP